MMGWYHDGLGWGGWLLMTVMMLAFWALVIFAVVAIFRGIGKDNGQDERGSRTRPEDILEERFARGEIEADELDARMRILHEVEADHSVKSSR